MCKLGCKSLVHELIDQANQNGGIDNTTVVACRFIDLHFGVEDQLVQLAEKYPSPRNLFSLLLCSELLKANRLINH